MFFCFFLGQRKWRSPTSLRPGLLYFKTYILFWNWHILFFSLTPSIILVTGFPWKVMWTPFTKNTMQYTQKLNLHLIQRNLSGKYLAEPKTNVGSIVFVSAQSIQSLITNLVIGFIAKYWNIKRKDSQMRKSLEISKNLLGIYIVIRQSVF